MRKKEMPDLEVCKTCRVGSCCYEGAEVSIKEMKRILQFNPKVPKPWFRLVEEYEEPQEKYPFTTIERNGSCVFHDKDNQCIIYKIRPQNCRDFPLEEGNRAAYYERLCVVFFKEWPNNRIKRSFLQRERVREAKKK